MCAGHGVWDAAGWGGRSEKRPKKAGPKGSKLRFLEKHVFWSDIRANTTTRSAWCVTTKKRSPP